MVNESGQKNLPIHYLQSSKSLFCKEVLVRLIDFKLS